MKGGYEKYCNVESKLNYDLVIPGKKFQLQV